MASLKHYLVLGIKFGIVSLLAALAIYFIFLRPFIRKRNGGIKEKILWLITVWYGLGLIGVLFFNRYGFDPMTIYNLHIFDFVRQTLVNSDNHAIWLAVLNFAAFVPLGILLALHFKGSKHNKIIYGLCFAIPLVVELIQFFTGIGILDVDDYMLNTLGILFGIAITKLVVDKKKLAPIIGMSMALAILTGFFIWYGVRPAGFIPEDFDNHTLYAETVDLSGIEEKLPENLMLYKTDYGDKNRAAAECDKIFEAIGEKRNTASDDIYDDVSVFRAENANVYMWYWYTGEFSLYGADSITLNINDIKNEISKLMLSMGIALPPLDEHQICEEESYGDRTYTISFDMEEHNGKIFDGTLELKLVDNRFDELNCKVPSIEVYKENEALSADEVKNCLENGKFQTKNFDTEKDTIKELKCIDMEVEYKVDGKNIYHPYYVLTCIADGEEIILTAPAI